MTMMTFTLCYKPCFYNYLCCFVESKIHYWPRYTNSWFLFKMAATPFWIPRNAAAILNLQKSAIMGRLWPVYSSCLSAHKFGANLSRTGQDVPFCVFWISKKCYFGPLCCRYLPAYKIWCILITNWPIYAFFVYFPEWRPQPSWFSKKWHFGPLMTLVSTVPINITNLV